ncbi:hypothetical protein C1I98_10585 [Spongiactinospora gelatinilytica]|uniref:Secreted protein n=1 Tax=Spongiactinospora gelatinilytica TaxID=2666298 RepID=A0A2W2HJ08_9ACTN|nr:hypothetical protein [Spongiactinospora gelatinilytica]PZG50380.1 hypothetical protein C1I98_10585 [Spongiactinospora gelatinilytica]
MRRTTRNLLGLAAVTATALAIALPASAASASATAPAAATIAADFEDSWGYDYSKWYDGSRAKARGDVWADEDGRVRVSGRLYDKNSPWYLCGYAQVKFENEDGDEWTRSVKKCGSSGYRSFHYSGHEVDTVQVRVCYWHSEQEKKKYCGRWDYIFEADEDL